MYSHYIRFRFTASLYFIFALTIYIDLKSKYQSECDNLINKIYN